MMENHEADFVLVSFREGSFDFIPMQRDPLLAWVPATHRRVREGVYPLSDFLLDPYISTYPDQVTDNSRAFAMHGLEPKARYSSIDIRSTLAMVSAGLGVSLNNGMLSHGLDLTNIAVLPTEPACFVDIGAAMPKKRDRSPAANAFLTFAMARLPEASN